MGGPSGRRSTDDYFSTILKFATPYTSLHGVLGAQTGLPSSGDGPLPRAASSAASTGSGNCGNTPSFCTPEAPKSRSCSLTSTANWSVPGGPPASIGQEARGSASAPPALILLYLSSRFGNSRNISPPLDSRNT